MQETEFIWMDGKLIPFKDAKIHVLTHALHYGSAVFEGIRVYKTNKGPAVFRLKEHIKRLIDSANSLFMKVPYSNEEIENAIIQTIKENKIVEGYIRPIIFYGFGKMGLDPRGAQINIVIAVWPWGKYLGDSVKVKTSPYMRIHPKSLKADKKVCGHYVNSTLASLEAKEQGYDEALLLDYKGNVAEGPGENIFLIKDNKLKTPKLDHQILPGITRDAVMQIAKDLGYSVEETDINPDELVEADELFFTGTAAEITFISKLDKKEFEKGKISKQIKNKFLDIVHGRDEKYKEWLRYLE